MFSTDCVAEVSVQEYDNFTFNSKNMFRLLVTISNVRYKQSVAKRWLSAPLCCFTNLEYGTRFKVFFTKLGICKSQNILLVK